MIKRSNTPVNPPKHEQVGQAPRRIFGKDLKNIIGSYHNKLIDPTSSAQKQPAQHLPNKQKQPPKTNSQHCLPHHNPTPSSKHKQTSTVESTSANSPKSCQQIKQYLKSRAPRTISQISSELTHTISLEMRELIVIWLIQLCNKMPLKFQTLFLAVGIFDRIVGNFGGELQFVVCVENLQLLALACLFISAKYEQIYPPPADLLVKVADYTYSKKKLIQMQAQILISQQFILTFPTRYTFISQILNEQQQFSLASQNKTKRLQHMCLYLSELSLLQLWEDTTEEQLAEAIVFLCKKVTGGQVASMQSKKVYGLAWKMMQVWKMYKNSVVSYLFDTDKYSFVGGIYLEDI